MSVNKVISSIVVLLILFFISYSTAKAPTSQSTQAGFTVGETCTVTSGPNKGKKGTITHEPGEGYWCEGSWGGTQCKPNRCSTAVRQVPSGVFTLTYFLDTTSTMAPQHYMQQTQP